MRIVDLSVAIENSVPADPPGLEPEIDYLDHDAGAADLTARFTGLERAQLPDGKGWAIERLRVTTHNGTHMDAPWHYHPTMDHGVRAATIDEIPLEWCMQPGMRLDFRELPDGHVVSADELEAEFDRIGRRPAPLEIVVCNTAAGERYGEADYIDRGCGFGREATLALLSHGVRVVGTDGWSWDAPFSATARRFARDRDPAIIWEGHKAGRERGYCQLEKLHHLELLPDQGFTIVCFPVAIRSASAAWARVVALVDE